MLQAAPIIRAFSMEPRKAPGSHQDLLPGHIRASWVGWIMSGQEKQLISTESLEGEPASDCN